jgi:hypothetical protein
MRRKVSHRDERPSPRFKLTSIPSLAGFKRIGIDMSHRHFLPRKTIRPRDSSRDPSSDRFDYESSVPEGDDKVASKAPMVLAEPLPFESQAETCVASVLD